MTELKEDIERERDALRAENAALREQLDTVGAVRTGTAPEVQHQFVLSEGQRQELMMQGNTQVDGRYVSAAEVQEMLGPDQEMVEIPEPKVIRQIPKAAAREPIAGVDFIYPSVEYGKIDPAVAGTPGVNGPSADQA